MTFFGCAPASVEAAATPCARGSTLVRAGPHQQRGDGNNLRRFPSIVPAHAPEQLVHLGDCLAVLRIRREIAQLVRIVDFVVQLDAPLALVPLRVPPVLGADAVAHERRIRRDAATVGFWAALTKRRTCVSAGCRHSARGFLNSGVSERPCSPAGADSRARSASVG